MGGRTFTLSLSHFFAYKKHKEEAEIESFSFPLFQAARLKATVNCIMMEVKERKRGEKKYFLGKNTMSSKTYVLLSSLEALD